jgi:hypothetical protein
MNRDNIDMNNYEEHISANVYTLIYHRTTLCRRNTLYTPSVDVCRYAAKSLGKTICKSPILFAIKILMINSSSRTLVKDNYTGK